MKGKWTIIAYVSQVLDNVRFAAENNLIQSLVYCEDYARFMIAVLSLVISVIIPHIVQETAIAYRRSLIIRVQGPYS